MAMQTTAMAMQTTAMVKVNMSNQGITFQRIIHQEMQTKLPATTIIR